MLQDRLDLVAFALDESVYAVLASDVVRIVPTVQVTKLPDAPSVVEGVVEVAGEFVPVFDLRQRFGLPARPFHIYDQMILAQTPERQVLFRVDQTLGVQSVSASDIQEMRAVSARLVRGVARGPDGAIIIHDLARFLTQEESIQLDQAMSEEDRADVPTSN